MKKIVILLTPIILLVALYGCSKDHDAPTFDVYKQAKAPENVIAVYIPADDKVNVSWEMADTSGVIDYVVSVSDSSVFNDGQIQQFPTNLKVGTLNQPYSSEYDASTYVSADQDSLILYFTVSAVFDNSVFSNYIGPTANVDSTLVLRK